MRKGCRNSYRLFLSILWFLTKDKQSQLVVVSSHTKDLKIKPYCSGGKKNFKERDIKGDAGSPGALLCRLRLKLNCASPDMGDQAHPKADSWLAHQLPKGKCELYFLLEAKGIEW